MILERDGVLKYFRDQIENYDLPLMANYVQQQGSIDHYLMREIITNFLYYFIIKDKNSKYIQTLGNMLARFESGDIKDIKPTRNQLIYFLYLLSSFNLDETEEQNTIYN